MNKFETSPALSEGVRGLKYFQAFMGLGALNYLSGVSTQQSGRLSYRAPPRQPVEVEVPLGPQAQRYGFAKGNPSMTKTTTKRRRPAKGGKKVATVAQVKRMLKAGSELKQLGISVQGNNSDATASSAPLTYNLTAQIVQGTADGNRIGDTVTLEAVYLKSWFATSTTNNDSYMVRIMLLWSGEEFNPSTTVFSAAGLGYTQIFAPNCPNTVCAQAVVNTKAVTVVYDQTYAMHSMVSGVSMAEILTGGAKLGGKKFNYQSAGSVYGKNTNLYLVACCINKTNSALNDIDINVHAVIKFRDE